MVGGHIDLHGYTGELFLSTRKAVQDVVKSFSNDGVVGSENVKKAIGLISKTTTFHVQQTFLYISLSSLHDYDVKIPNFTFYGGRKQATTNLSFSFKT